MPRPRTVSDDVLLADALDIVHTDGPDALSFGAVARRVGLAGSTIVQRFGSKPELLRATLLHAWDELDRATAAAIAAAPQSRAGAIELLVGLSGTERSLEDYAQGLLVFREDLRDPVLRERGRAWVDTLADALGRRLARPADPVLGRMLVVHWQGSLSLWGFRRQAPLADAVRADLEAFVARVTRR
jgi:AcrR family transcriptional regulator